MTMSFYKNPQWFSAVGVGWKIIFTPNRRKSQRQGPRRLQGQHRRWWSKSESSYLFREYEVGWILSRKKKERERGLQLCKKRLMMGLD